MCSSSLFSCVTLATCISSDCALSIFCIQSEIFSDEFYCWEEIFLVPTELNCQKEAGLEIHLLISWCQHLVCVEPKEVMYSNYPLNLILRKWRRISLIERSTMPFSCLEAVIVKICSEPTILHNSAITELQSCVPLLDSIWCGAPYLPIHANKHVANVFAKRSGTG